MADTEPDFTQVQRIAEQMIAALGGNTDALTVVSSQQLKADRMRTVWLQRFTVVFAVLFVWVGVVALQQRATNHRLSNTIEDVISTRAEGRVIACTASEAFIAAHNGLVDQDEATFKVILAAPAVPAETLKFAQDRIDAFESNRVPDRDCTPAGIAIYYKEK